MSSTPSFSDEQISAGEELLRDLLPRARQHARDRTVRAISPLSHVMHPHITEANMRALIIHSTPNGGWLADLLFAHMPLGVANILGTPVTHPKATRDDAVQDGFNLICTALALSQQPGSRDAPSDPVFLYYNMIVPLLPKALVILRRFDGKPKPPVDFIYRRLHEVTRAVFPRRFPTTEAFWQLPPELQQHLMVLIHMAAGVGIMRFPPIEESEPLG